MSDEVSALVVGALVWVAIIGAGSASVAHAMHRKRMRRVTLARWADARGWTFSSAGRHVRKRWMSPPFDRGKLRRVENVLTGTFRGRDTVSMTYFYSTGFGKNLSVHHFHVLALRLPAPLPWMQLTPDWAEDVTAKAFNGQGVTVRSREFNETWRVRGLDAQYPQDLLQPRMMERLLQPDATGRSITIEGQDILLHAPGRQKVEMIDVYLNVLSDLVELVPGYLWLPVRSDRF